LLDEGHLFTSNGNSDKNTPAVGSHAAFIEGLPAGGPLAVHPIVSGAFRPGLPLLAFTEYSI
jgi:hypothetical protein